VPTAVEDGAVQRAASVEEQGNGEGIWQILGWIEAQWIIERSIGYDYGTLR
jgi:hypothetical protein